MKRLIANLWPASRISPQARRRKYPTSQRILRSETLESRRLLASYYVDASIGSDSNTGFSTDAPFQSLQRLAAVPLAPGDAVFLARGSAWAETLVLNDPGTAGDPIVAQAYGTGVDPLVRGLNVSADYVQVADLIVDRDGEAADAVIIRSAHDVVLRNLVVRNGTKDGIDVDDADGLLIDGLLIHHFLAGSFTTQVDAHGIVATDTQGMTIRNTEIHHVSGDSFQSDPDRDRTISTDIVIEQCHFWTGPLESDFYDLWKKGERPGENAIDTKVVKDGWDTLERMRLTVKDVVAHGWVADSYIANRAAFNIKEKVEAIFDGVTVYDSEIGFRLRGTRGNANVSIKNAVLYDLEKAIRAEDDLANLYVANSTFGSGLTTVVQFAGGDGGRASWAFLNNAFLSPRPTDASDPSNLIAASSDFLSVGSNDYHLTPTSNLIDGGTALAEVLIDRDGNLRPQGDGYDVGAYERDPGTVPIAEDDSFIVLQDSDTTSFPVLGNDITDPGETLTIISVSGGSQGGAVNIVDGNSIDYRPAAGFVGQENFTYTINDGTVGNDDTATVTVNVIPLLDYGDAPNGYPVTLAEDGARHDEIGPRLGAVRDLEADGLHTEKADGDGVDEDGVTFGSIQMGNGLAAMNVELQNATSARVDAWMDFNADGRWDPSEKILDSLLLENNLQTLNYALPTTMAEGYTFARVRISSAGGLSPTGFAPDGEVEDYRVLIGTPPKVESIEINQGQVQRSSLDSLSVTFDRIIDIEDIDNAIRITNAATGESVGKAARVIESESKTLVEITFVPGPSVTSFGSLVDGSYRLTIDGGKVTYRGVELDGDGDGSAGGDKLYGDLDADQFYRRYGDSNGNRVVDLLDFAEFRQTFASTAPDASFRAEFDSDGDQTIGLLDFAAFRRNFGT